MLVAIRTIMVAQSHETEATAKAVSHLLDYCATYHDTLYNTSGMVLKGYSDVSYLSEQHMQNRTGGYFYLGNKHSKKFKGPLLIV
eukprot:10095465-Ditylum_brightwellii.AAC.1